MIIMENRLINMDDVRDCCINNDLYTAGNSEDYDKMLRMAEEDFSLELLYKIAADITEHSVDQTVENVMFLLNKDAVRTFYEIR